MSVEASREIMWNVSHPIHAVMMYVLFAAALVVACIGVLRHAELVRSGKPSDIGGGQWWNRSSHLFSWGLFQRGVTREWFQGFLHTLIYLGFLVLLFTTTMVFLHHDLGINIYKGDFYLAVTILSDVFGVALLFGIALAAHRRFLTKQDLVHTRSADTWLLAILALLVVQGYVLEGLRIHVTQDPWRWYSPVGFLVSKFFWSLSPGSARTLHVLMWWFHTITVMVGVALIPYSKFFHVIASAANLFLKDLSRPKGALSSPGDIAAIMERGEDVSLGLTSIKDYSWKHLLDLEACTSCGRCQDVCPAYASSKPLSPKWVILDTRNHALALHAEGKLGSSVLPASARKIDEALTGSLFLSSSGVERSEEGFAYVDGGTFRGANSAIHTVAELLGGDADRAIAGDVIAKETFWSCTTCFACVEACPVGINHVDQIVGNRRSLVLMQGDVPSEAQATLRALEGRGNPYGPADQRTQWLKDLDVPILQAGDKVDYLYWVGCISAFDPRKQKIAKALVALLKKAGVSFGVLGNAEGCSGDPARRLGEENLFQTMAKQNIELLRSITFKTLVANCPHCFHTIKNEYPQFGNLGEGRSPDIIHHSQLLRQLMSEGKLAAPNTENSKITFHDPCYLGRYNDEYDAPREVAQSRSSLPILEMEKSREKSMCCGAGGGHFWMDLKSGDRINALRADQAAATGATIVATACPFCLHMMEDGMKLTNRDDAIVVKDIAEVLAEGIE